MGKQDIESVLDGVKAFLTANLNTQISALNAEKDDGIVLKTVDANAYHFQYPQDRAELSDPFILYDEAGEPVIQSNGGIIATVHQVGVTVFLVDNGLDQDLPRRLFRYRRALLDLFVSQWATVFGSNKFAVKAWIPTPPFKNEEVGYTGRAVGIVLAVAITD